MIGVTGRLGAVGFFDAHDAVDGKVADMRENH